MFNWLKKKYSSSSLVAGFAINGDRAKRDAKKQIDEGYIKNAIVYRCVNVIAQAASNINVKVYTKSSNGELQDADNSFVAEILSRPNQCQGRQSFIEAAISSYFITGNAYVIGLPYGADKMPSGRPVQMHVMCPQNVKPYGKKYIPDGFKVDKENGQQEKYPIVNGVSAIAHFKNYSPTDPQVGLSPLYAAGAPVDVHNSALNWNASLLENGARPSGVFTTEHDVDEETTNSIMEQMATKFGGKKNTGKTMVLGGGMKFEAAMLNMKDLEFSQAIKDMAVLICSAFGVPFQLVVQGESSMNNMKSAHENLYMDTVIPVLQGFFDELSRWFSALDSQDYVIKLDLDSIPALEERRERKRKSLREDVALGVISRDEYRIELGREPVGGMAESLLIPANVIPADLGTMPQGEASAAYEFGTKQTDFPENGDDMQVSLRNSNYPQFDREFAKRIKENHPDVWDKGGNTRGNEAYELWGRARAGSDDQDVLDWIEEREAWAARHEGNFRLAGVVAQMKWGVIGTRGEKYMKDLINEAIDDE